MLAYHYARRELKLKYPNEYRVLYLKYRGNNTSKSNRSRATTYALTDLVNKYKPEYDELYAEGLKLGYKKYYDSFRSVKSNF